MSTRIYDSAGNLKEETVDGVAVRNSYIVSATIGSGVIGNNLTIIGSASKIVKLSKVTIIQTVTATIRGTSLVRAKLLSASTTGTPVIPIALDTENPAASATVSFDATAPTVIGNIGSEWIEMDDAGAIGRARRVVGFEFGSIHAGPVVLRGVSEFFQINVDGIFDGLVGGSFDVSAEFTEE